MQQFISIGEKLLLTLDRVGDWLLFEPFSGAISIGFQQSPNYHWITNAILGFLESNPSLVHINIGSMLIGTLLVTMLGYKVFKFFVNIL